MYGVSSIDWDQPYPVLQGFRVWGFGFIVRQSDLASRDLLIRLFLVALVLVFDGLNGTLG